MVRERESVTVQLQPETVAYLRRLAAAEGGSALADHDPISEAIEQLVDRALEDEGDRPG
jgi:hypothetical protein